MKTSILNRTAHLSAGCFSKMVKMVKMVKIPMKSETDIEWNRIPINTEEALKPEKKNKQQNGDHQLMKKDAK